MLVALRRWLRTTWSSLLSAIAPGRHPERGARPRRSSIGARCLERLERYTGLHIAHVFCRDLNEPAPEWSTEPWTIRLATEAELSSFASDPVLELSREFIPGGFRRGGCAGAFEGGRLDAYSWFSYEDTAYRDGVMVRVPPHAIYRYKAFVRPEKRGLRLAPRLLVLGSALARRPGHRYVFSLVAAYNAPSHAASRAAGRRRIGTIVFLRRGRRLLAWHSRGVRELGVRVYAPGRESPARELVR